MLLTQHSITQSIIVRCLILCARHKDINCRWWLFFCSTNGWPRLFFCSQHDGPFKQCPGDSNSGHTDAWLLKWRALTASFTLEAVRLCSLASGRRNEQNCWTERSSPLQTLAAGKRGPLTGAGRAGKATRPRECAAETMTYETLMSQSQKGRKRIQRRCEACSHTHAFTTQHRLSFSYSHR